MAAKMMFIDTSKCIGCRACQVACKQWHNLPAETTTFTGKYTNPSDLSANTLTLVNFTEYQSDKLSFLFFKKQCMHCNRAVCKKRCPTGVEKTTEGFVVFNANCTPENVRITRVDKKFYFGNKNYVPTPAEVIQFFLDGCPYHVPRYDSVNNKFVKCDFCYDRFHGGKYTTYNSEGKPTTACQLTCPTGAITTGTKGEIYSLAQQRLRAAKREGHRGAGLWGGRGRVVYLLTEYRQNYDLGLKPCGMD